MIIHEKVYLNITKKLSINKFESGGIIGIKDNAIVSFRLDSGYQCCDRYYIPNTAFLNRIIKKWENHKIIFCGIIHSHINGCIQLSKEDKKYALLIKTTMPDLKVLLFPIFTLKNNKPIITCYDVLNNFNIINLIIKK